MMDLFATAQSLSASRRNTLENNIIHKNRRWILVGAAALVILGGGKFAPHHEGNATPVAAVGSAAPANVLTARPQRGKRVTATPALHRHI